MRPPCRRAIGSGPAILGTGDRAKALETPVGTYCTLPFDAVLSGNRVVGLSTVNGYTVNIGSWVSLAMIDDADARDGAEVTVVWGEESGGTAKPTVERHVQANLRATISTTTLVR